MSKKTWSVQLKDIPLLDKIGYGFGNLGSGIVFQALASYLVFYTTSVLRIPGSLIGLAISISVVWDGVTDPIMGYISDKTRLRRLGRRHVYILGGTIAIAVSNFLLWSVNPDLATWMKFAWVFVVVILVKTFLTVFSTPHTALGAELSVDYDERTSIQGIRTIFFLTGLLLASVMGLAFFFRPTPEYPQGQLNPAAYRDFGLAASGLMILSGIYTFMATYKYIQLLPGSDDAGKSQGRIVVSLYKRLKSALKNSMFKYIVYGCLFTNIATAFAGTLGLHVFTYTFAMNNFEIALIIGLMFFISIASQPAWIAIAKRIDKKPAVMLGTFISSIGCIFLFAMVFWRHEISGNALFMLPFSILAGFGTGGLFSIPYSMVADTIDIEESATGIRSEGLHYGSLTLVYKISQSLAILLLGILLDLIGFDAALETQSNFTLITLGIIISLGGLASFLLARLAYRKYDLDKNKLKDIQNEIRKKEIPEIAE